MDELLRPLAYAFWTEVMEDLLRGDLVTYLWLYTETTPGFVWWSETTGKDPEVWRTLLVRLWSLRGTQEGERALKVIRETMLA